MIPSVTRMKNMRRLLASHRVNGRFFSTAEEATFATAAGEAAPPSPPPPPSAPMPSRIPSRHSRKRLPPVCIDPVMLKSLTDEVLQAPQGSLFTYTVDRNSQEDAWAAADIVVQKVEFLVRGYAAQLPGTMWQRWILPLDGNHHHQHQKQKPQSLLDPYDLDSITHNLETMEKLLDRIWDEGHAYMTVRADRMQELADRGQISPAPEPEKLIAGGDDDEEDSFPQLTPSQEADLEKALEAFDDTEELHEEDEKELRNIAKNFGMEESYDSQTSVKEAAAVTAEEDEDDGPFMNDFALPGPSIGIFHNILDAMACHPKSSFVSIYQAQLMFTDIVSRHEVDGGDLKNDQPHTAVSAISYNAPIRVMAELPYTGSDVKLRDDGLLLAFQAYDALTHSDRCLRNPATFAYLLQTIAKYMPTSRNKGNIAAGMFYVAQQEGCVDKTVLDAYELANTPSNGPEFESWSSSSRGKSIGDLPMSWRRNNKSRRHHIREATY